MTAVGRKAGHELAPDAGARERLPAEIDVALEAAADRDVAGEVDGDARLDLLSDVAEALAPQVVSIGCQLGQKGS